VSAPRSEVPRPPEPWPGAAPGEPAAEPTALAELADALAEQPPRIPSKYLYDERGSALFDRICDLPEYYPTRSELAIMEQHAAEMARALGPDATVVEYGTGTGRKTRLLLAALDRPCAYVPVDVAAEFLSAASARLAAEFPAVAVVPVWADFTRPFLLPPDVPRGRRRVAYFPGSTIGNFEPDEARALLAEMRDRVGPGGAALVGVDLRKDPRVLEAAYDDAAGVTARFNLNVLAHVNRRFGLAFDPSRFRHRAPWVDRAGRIEMRLVSTVRHEVDVAGRRYRFEPGDYILTEYSHKYRLTEFAALAQTAGWRTRRTWTDAEARFSVHLLET
jgi:dimethylhistidine N-methyltransferase